MRCNCYVRYLSPEIRFGLHHGAHNPKCPRYRVSLDPVDRANDDDFRREVEYSAHDCDRYGCSVAMRRLPVGS